MAVTTDTWRDADGQWVPAPGASHLKRFRPVFFKAGRHTIEIQFKASGKNPKERTYRYWWKSDDTGFASCINVWNALATAAEPGKVVDQWLKKAGVSYAEI